MRARNIKPGFFRNDVLAELEPLTRILFSGLWCIADREGRLEDRPKRIKADVLPYDECDIDAMLDDLASAGFIQRYTVENVEYIAILAFSKHQNPHKNEAGSTIPAPTGETDSDSEAEQHSTSTVQAQYKHTTNPADSGFLIPDSLIPDTKTAREACADVAQEPEPIQESPPPVPDDTPHSLYVTLLDVVSKPGVSIAPNWERKQHGIAKRLLEQGYGTDKVRRCLVFMRSQAWRTSPMDLGTVEKYIGTWEANGEPERDDPTDATRRHDARDTGADDTQRRGYSYDEIAERVAYRG